MSTNTRCAHRFPVIWALSISLAASASASTRFTAVMIEGDAFYINGRPSYDGRSWRGRTIEGLLFNARMVQGIFDDLNPATAGQWAYPDTGAWDPDRNTAEFIRAMEHWRRHGLLAFTINLQGGCPEGYCQDQPWHNSAITETGELRDDYLGRLERILDRADELGMVVILGVYYFGQDQRLQDETAILRGLDNTVNWVLDRGYLNILIETNNECDKLEYDHAVLRKNRVHELIARAQSHSRGGYRLYAGTSLTGGAVPTESIVRQSDFILLHGNSVGDPQRIAAMVAETRRVTGYRPMPILFNEDDHYRFEAQYNNMVAALGEYASWGFFNPGDGNYHDGYQCPPINWDINTPVKNEFFCSVDRLSGEECDDGCCNAFEVVAGSTPPAPPACGLGAGVIATLAAAGLAAVSFRGRRRITG